METVTDTSQSIEQPPAVEAATPEAAPPRDARVVRTFVQRIRTPLTDVQKLALHETGRLLREEARDREEQLAEHAKEERQAIKQLEARVAVIDDQIVSGAEEELDCVEEHCYTTNEARIVRKDNGEVIERRTLTSDELQMGLDFEAQPPSYAPGDRVVDVCDAGGVVIGWDDEEATRELLAELKVEDVAALAAIPAAELDAHRARLVPVRWDDQGGVTLEERDAIRPEPKRTNGAGVDKPIALLDGLVCEVCREPTTALTEIETPATEGGSFGRAKACAACVRKLDAHDSIHGEEDDAEARAAEEAAAERRDAERGDEPTQQTTKKNGRRK